MKAYGVKLRQYREDLGATSQILKLSSHRRRSWRRLLAKRARAEAKKDLRE